MAALVAAIHDFLHAKSRVRKARCPFRDKHKNPLLKITSRSYVLRYWVRSFAPSPLDRLENPSTVIKFSNHYLRLISAFYFLDVLGAPIQGPVAQMISDDELSERLVHGISSMTMPDADVRRDVKLNGRQFDVVAQFTKGAHRFLVVIEVRNRTRRASADEIEGFITKAHDQLANKIIVVTKAGFQTGAIDVARKHGVDLFQVKLLAGDQFSQHGTFTVFRMSRKDKSYKVVDVIQGLDQRLPKLEIGEEIPINCVEKCWVRYENGEIIELPSEPSQMLYYMSNTKFQDGISLNEFTETISTGTFPSSGQAEEIEISPAKLLTPPDNFFLHRGKITGIRIFVKTVTGREMRSGRIMVDPNALPIRVEYTNVLSGETIETNSAAIPLGDSELQVGQFYMSDFPLCYFYYKSISNEEAEMYLVENFQHGMLFQAVIRINTQDARRYILLKRLMLEKTMRRFFQTIRTSSRV